MQPLSRCAPHVCRPRTPSGLKVADLVAQDAGGRGTASRPCMVAHIPLPSQPGRGRHPNRAKPRTSRRSRPQSRACHACYQWGRHTPTTRRYLQNRAPPLSSHIDTSSPKGADPETPGADLGRTRTEPTARTTGATAMAATKEGTRRRKGRGEGWRSPAATFLAVARATRSRSGGGDEGATSEGAAAPECGPSPEPLPGKRRGQGGSQIQYFTLLQFVDKDNTDSRYQ
jgi:hypothetical protein